MLHGIKGYHHAADCPSYLPSADTPVESTAIIRGVLSSSAPRPTPTKEYVRDLFRVEVCGFSNTSAQFDKDHHSSWFIAVESNICAREILALAHKRFDSLWWQVHTVTDIQFVGKLVSLDGEPLYEKED